MPCSPSCLQCRWWRTGTSGQPASLVGVVRPRQGWEGVGGSPRPQPAGELITGTGLQALSCFCAWGEGSGGRPCRARVGAGAGVSLPGHRTSHPPQGCSLWGLRHIPLLSPQSPESHAWASQRALGVGWGWGPWGGWGEGTDLLSRHLVGLGHEQPPDAEDRREGPD